MDSQVIFLKDKIPVLKFTTDYTCDYVNALYKTLVEKYPNLICIPQSFDIDWEKYVTTVRQKFKRAVNELEEQNKGCSGCLHFGDEKYKCELCTRFGHDDYYVSNG